MDISGFLLKLSIMIVPLLMAVTFHELAHGYVAERLGDPTARMAGRLTFNPIKHLDLFGTLVFIITQRIGWAKPVPVNPYYFRNQKRDMMWVALAGPAANLILAFAFAILLRLIGNIQTPLGSSGLSGLIEPLSLMCGMGIILNVGLAIFNLTPVPPLDGSKIFMGILPKAQAEAYAKLEPYGFVILMILLFIPGPKDIFLKGILYPLIHFMITILIGHPG